MIRNLSRLSAAAVVAAMLGSTAWAQERVVNVYNWSDYIDQAVIDEFTKETGIKVVYDVYDSNEVLEASSRSESPATTWFSPRPCPIWRAR